MNLPTRKQVNDKVAETKAASKGTKLATNVVLCSIAKQYGYKTWPDMRDAMRTQGKWNENS